jgi:hypothetical protein
MDFKELIHRQDLSPEQIYVASEMRLQWKDLSADVGSQEDFDPSQTPSNSENITVICCANASGTHRLPLVCAGMMKEPGYGTGAEVKCFPIDCCSHKLALMSGKMFHEWFHDKFVLAVTEHLKSHNIS